MQNIHMYMYSFKNHYFTWCKGESEFGVILNQLLDVTM